MEKNIFINYANCAYRLNAWQIRVFHMQGIMFMHRNACITWRSVIMVCMTQLLIKCMIICMNYSTLSWNEQLLCYKTFYLGLVIDIKTIDGSRWHGRPVGVMVSYLRYHVYGIMSTVPYEQQKIYRQIILFQRIYYLSIS